MAYLAVVPAASHAGLGISVVVGHLVKSSRSRSRSKWRWKKKSMRRGNANGQG